MRQFKKRCQSLPHGQKPLSLFQPATMATRKSNVLLRQRLMTEDDVEIGPVRISLAEKCEGEHPGYRKRAKIRDGVNGDAFPFQFLIASLRKDMNLVPSRPEPVSHLVGISLRTADPHFKPLADQGDSHVSQRTSLVQHLLNATIPL